MLNINNNFPDAMGNKLRLAGCPDPNFLQEDGRTDPFPLTHSKNLSYREDKEFDLGSLLDYVPSSAVSDDKLKRPIVELEDDYATDTRASRIKRTRRSEDVTTSGADVIPDVAISVADMIPDLAISAADMNPDVAFSAADMNPDVAFSAADVFPDVATSAARVTPPVETGYPRFRNYQEIQWQKQFQALLQYKQKHGHCCVPNKHDENPVLGRWVSSTFSSAAVSNDSQPLTDQYFMLLLHYFILYCYR